MTFKEYYKRLGEFLTANSKIGDYEVLSSKDEEGNGYNTIHYGPCVGSYEDGEFQSVENLKEDDEFNEEDFNSVCVN